MQKLKKAYLLGPNMQAYFQPCILNSKHGQVQRELSELFRRKELKQLEYKQTVKFRRKELKQLEYTLLLNSSWDAIYP